MQSRRISILGDDVLIFSSGASSREYELYKRAHDKNALFLYPSKDLDADTAVLGHTKHKSKIDFLTTALAVSRFLIEKRGLPLDELMVEFENKNNRVFNTGQGVYSLKVEKCKEILSNTAELYGTDVKYYRNGSCAVVRAERHDSFDDRALRRLLLLSEVDRAIVYSDSRGLVEAKSYTATVGATLCGGGVLSLIHVLSFLGVSPAKISLDGYAFDTEESISHILLRVNVASKYNNVS